MALPPGAARDDSRSSADRLRLLDRRMTGAPLPFLAEASRSLPEDGGAAAFAAAHAAAAAALPPSAALTFPRPPSASKQAGDGVDGGGTAFKAVDTGPQPSAARPFGGGAPQAATAAASGAGGGGLAHHQPSAWRPVTSADNPGTGAVAGGGGGGGGGDGSRSSWGGGGGGGVAAATAAAAPAQPFHQASLLGRTASVDGGGGAGRRGAGKRKQPEPARRAGGAPDAGGADAAAAAAPASSARKAPRGASASPQVGTSRPSPGGVAGRRAGSGALQPLPAHQRSGGSGGGAAGIGGGGAPTALLTSFNSAADGRGGGGPPPPPSAARPSPARPPSAPAASALVAARREWAAREAELAAALAAARAEAGAARAAAAEAEASLAAERGAHESDAAASRAALASLAAAAFRADRDLARARVRADTPRLGGLRAAGGGGRGVAGLLAVGGGVGCAEVWEDGFAVRDLEARAARLAAQREAVEAARKAGRARLPPPGHADGGVGGSLPPPPPPASASAAGAAASAPAPPAYIAPDEYIARDEAFKARLAALKREEDGLARDRERVEGEKAAHAAELRRLADEDGSRFGGFPVLAGRYALGRLLGRGGFSEVFEAVDLVAASTAGGGGGEGGGGGPPAPASTAAAAAAAAATAPAPALPRVAIKLHQLSPGWPDARKASYVRHAVREYSIHRALRHERVVGLREIFEVDGDAFATVLDHCPGGDLDAHLRSHGALPEREARAIASQVFAGLAYLNAPPRRVIHYDLKPANILFDGAGGVKLTDFGLSKVVEDGHTRGLELTSQGAGTYWYLPPECFETGGPGPPLITNKVDVWAAGVILFQMLYGRRPWGEGRSQEALLREGTMLSATRSLDFPAKPAVSAEAKAFLSACLAYRQADRLDVHAAAAHPYLVLKRPGGRGGGGGGGGGGG